MPIAVLRRTVRELPTTFFLDDAASLDPGVPLSAQDSILVGARIARTGYARRQAGDLESQSAEVHKAASGVEVVIDRVVP
ncbi:MAG: hypothetical protein R3E83_18970 [Burkholderiaceae bacterium]